jgi:type VI secretion system secreted protein Hcp
VANQAYVSIHGKLQGPFQGNELHASHAKDIEIDAFSYGAQAPRDVATGQASGKRQHSPITITKEWGASSPQLWQSCVSDEILHSVVIQFVGRPGKSSPESVHYTIHLTNATVSRVRYIGFGKDEVTLTYGKIETSGGVPPLGVYLPLGG